MLQAIRRIALGIAVVAVASAILQLCDLEHRERAAARAALARKHVWKIYFVQYNDVIDVEDAERGVLDGLARLVNRRDYEVRILNAQGDMATVSALIDAAVTGGADLLVTFSTPTLQAALRRAQNVPFVFNYVAHGLEAEAGKSNTDRAPMSPASASSRPRRSAAGISSKGLAGSHLRGGSKFYHSQYLRSVSNPSSSILHHLDFSSPRALAVFIVHRLIYGEVSP